MSTVDRLLEEARADLVRLEPSVAARAMRRGALLVDIRPERQRREEGEIPGALVVERNVLEWRLDPTSPHRLPEAEDPRRVIVVLCSEGYASSFAAATLRQLGLPNATDLAGGFRAWRDAGLPVRSGGG
jgi:rhodanese-related sulfurtransferase